MTGIFKEGIGEEPLLYHHLEGLSYYKEIKKILLTYTFKYVHYSYMLKSLAIGGVCIEGIIS
ncbi:hypothetical protein D1839_13980 [Roseburia sp. 1XD42-34]|nr:hypothetical protein [Roseburia sp. 1XD42-34]RKI76054.1 hypothetical protein D7V87_14610 [Clostridium sp. 1xD42-85]